MTTDRATLAAARAAGIDAAIEAIEAHVDDTASNLARGLPDLGRQYSAASRLVIPAVTHALRKLAAETRKAEPNPFDGWTIQPWEGVYLWANKEGEEDDFVGVCTTHGGWLVWLPRKGVDQFDQGPETGDEGRKLAEKALIKAGANIPWHKDTTSADLIEAAGRG